VKRRRTFAILLGVAALAWAAPTRAENLQRPGDRRAPVYVVRHAERADAAPPGQAPPAVSPSMTARGSDPALSAEGKARAARLAAILRAAGITRIFTTEYARTRQTAEPLGAAASIAPTVIPADDMPALVQKVTGPGGPALVVGHSNTVPELLMALGVREPVSIADTEYDNLFIVVGGPGSPELLKLKF
jgi:phosphohistidine phosphatase SixA